MASSRSRTPQHQPQRQQQQPPVQQQPPPPPGRQQQQQQVVVPALQQQQQEVASPGADGPWACQLCTYDHTGAECKFLSCAMCGTPKIG